MNYTIMTSKAINEMLSSVGLVRDHHNTIYDGERVMGYFHDGKIGLFNGGGTLPLFKAKNVISITKKDGVFEFVCVKKKSFLSRFKKNQVEEEPQVFAAKGRPDYSKVEHK